MTNIRFIHLSNFSILIIITNIMIHQPRSPNVFDAVSLTGDKNSPPTAEQYSESPFYFNKRLESISQFIDFLENHPESHAQLTEIQLRWERSFFKNELKAALFLNYSLIKLYCQKNEELKQIKNDIQNRTEKKKISQEIEAKLQWSGSPTEYYLESPSTSTTMKKKLAREAFEAERKIIQAKYHKQCEELKKAIQHKDNMLRASKQENSYIRGELLQISQKNFALLNANRQAEDQKRKLQEESKQLKARLESFQEKKERKSPEKGLDRLTCSPITHSNDQFAFDQGQISFNHQFFHENIVQNKLLKKQIEDVQFQLQQIREQNAKLLALNNIQDDQHKEVMQQSCRLFFVELENQYIDIKRELQESIRQIVKYKSMIDKINETTKKNQQRQNEKCQQRCSNCLTIEKDYESLKKQNQQIHLKYQILREKFDKTISLELNQRQQWDAFLKDIKSSSNE